jgi:glycerol-3-phosphate acyltransferase PlsY
MTILIGMLLLGYLLGSIPTGKIICSWSGVNIQMRGSGNMGYANVLRIMGWKHALPVLVVDILKGVIAVSAGFWVLHSSVGAFWVGYMAIVGHVFPIWLRFRGGKGVATGLGVMMVISPAASLAGALVYVVLFNGYRYGSSKSSFAGVGALCILSTAINPKLWWIACILVVTAMYTLRHNMRGTVPDYG